MKKSDIEAAFERLATAMPEPRTELNYVNTYTLLVAVALSAQSTDVGVNKATKELFKTVHTPQAMLELGEAGLKKHIKTIGLYNSKAKNVMAAARILIEEHGGAVPEDREALERLPGVGRKTANVILNIAFGHSTCAVDTHIFRVSNRMGLAPGKTPLAVEKALMKRVPERYGYYAHHWLILHGRYTCKARTPACE
ncbi:MAG: endonuclease III, partial [Pseudomonadota bacterium]